jgi:hypothetical protein
MRNQNRVTVEFEGLDAVLAGFRSFRNKNTQARYLAAATKAAAKPAVPALRRNTPRGPTGNMKKAVSLRTVKYTNRDYGVGVTLVGYRRPSRSRNQLDENEKGHAQGLIEFGTKDRETKKGNDIASSFNKRGPFVLNRAAARKPKTAKQAAGVSFRPGIGYFKRPTKRQVRSHATKYNSTVMTVPKYPKAFFKKAAGGEQVQLGKTPVGGKARRPPIKTTFSQMLPTLRSRLRRELVTKLANATREFLTNKGKRRR